jgi:hypothetical protein
MFLSAIRAMLRSFALVVPLLAATSTMASADTAPAPLSAGEVDALVAPVALYPDQLLAKVFIASTYPLEIVEAARWVGRNGGLKGSALDNAIAKQSWDDSVKSLARVPVVVKMMNDRIDWTQKLGDAFLAQQEDVMRSVQRLRAQAQKSGYLKSSSQQRVEVQDQAIVIEPVKPEIVYVPYYNPTVVYGAWGYPAYPPYYWPPPPGYAWGAGVAAGIGFATGVAITAAFWNNGFNWRNNNVYINNHVNINNFNRTNIANRNNFISGQTWHHDPNHRRGVNYANNNLRQQYGRGTSPGADARRDFRGFGNNTSGNRGGNLSGATRNNALGDRGNLSGATRNGALDARGGGSALNRGSSRQASRGGGFDGIGNGASMNRFSDRGHTAMSGGFRGHGGGGGIRRR